MQKYQVELIFKILKNKLEEYMNENSDGFWDHEQWFSNFIGVTHNIRRDSPKGSFRVKISLDLMENDPTVESNPTDPHIKGHYILISVEVTREENFARTYTRMLVPNPGFVDKFKDYLDQATNHCMKYFEEVVPYV